MLEEGEEGLGEKGKGWGSDPRWKPRGKPGWKPGEPMVEKANPILASITHSQEALLPSGETSCPCHNTMDIKVRLLG